MEKWALASAYAGTQSLSIPRSLLVKCNYYRFIGHRCRRAPGFSSSIHVIILVLDVTISGSPGTVRPQELKDHNVP